MKVKRKNEANTIGQVETFFPEDEVSFQKERFSIPLLKEFFEKLNGADPLRTDYDHPPGVMFGHIAPQQGGFGMLLLQVDSGITYVVAPLTKDNLANEDVIREEEE